MDKISNTRITWYRDTNNKKLGGVCSGLSEMLELDVTLIRFIFVMLCVTPVPIITAYFVAWFIVPKKGGTYARTSTSSTNTTTTSSKEFLTESR